LKNGKVHLHLFFKYFLLALVHDGVGKILCVFRGERRVSIERDNTLDAERRRHTHGKVNVRCILLDHVLQVLIDDIHGSPH
jgi:hypothetical protein